MSSARTDRSVIDLNGKVVLITGAAQGAGAAMARVLAGCGARVAVADIRDEQGRAVAAEIGPAARYVRLDVTQEADWRRAVPDIFSAFGSLDILINNAAMLNSARIEDTDPQDYLRVIMVNQFGCFLGMRAVIPVMRAAGQGVIINISSSVGIEAMPGLVGYVASKWAVRGMTRTAALELGHDGIRVLSVCPANIKTPMALQSDFEGGDGGYYQNLPIPRQQDPEELARMVAVLASDLASYCTGSDFIVDGGTLAGRYFS